VRENIRTATQTHTLATQSSLLRNALAHHSCWIEATLGISLAETIATYTDLPLAQLAITHLLGLPQSHGYRSRLHSLDQRVLSIATPIDRPPLPRMGMGSELASKLASRRDHCLAEWADLPVALHVDGLSAPIVELPFATLLGPDSMVEDHDTVLIFERSLAAEVLALLEEAELHRYWGATEQKTRLRIQATSTIESDGLRSGRDRGMATICDKLGYMTATQRLGSIQYLLIRANRRPICWAWLKRSSTVSQRAASAARGSDRTYL
jgi:hypothetical protein